MAVIKANHAPRARVRLETDIRCSFVPLGT
jgi:hypothetical protein